MPSAWKTLSSVWLLSFVCCQPGPVMAVPLACGAGVRLDHKDLRQGGCPEFTTEKQIQGRVMIPKITRLDLDELGQKKKQTRKSELGAPSSFPCNFHSESTDALLPLPCPTMDPFWPSRFISCENEGGLGRVGPPVTMEAGPACCPSPRQAHVPLHPLSRLTPTLPHLSPLYLDFSSKPQAPCQQALMPG